MIGYLGLVRVTDGRHSIAVEDVAKVVITDRKGRTTTALIDRHDFGENCSQYHEQVIPVLKGYTVKRGNKVLERLHYGKGFYVPNQFNIPYHKGGWQSPNGTVWRRCSFLKVKGKCYTRFTTGAFREQYFRYSNGVMAYRIKRNDTTLIVRYPNKVKAMEIVSDTPIYNRQNANRDLSSGYPFADMEAIHNDNYTLTIYDRIGRVKEFVRIENRQRVGEVIKHYRKLFYLNGVPVDKKLYEAKPEDIDPKEVLRIGNAQCRMMMLRKVGLERVVKECNGKLIDSDKATGNELYDFKVRPDNEVNSFQKGDKAIRVLKVICPSTKQAYFLTVPPMPQWSTCETARQGTFNSFREGAKAIPFALET